MGGPLNGPWVCCTLLLITEKVDVPRETTGFSQEQGHPWATSAGDFLLVFCLLTLAITNGHRGSLPSLFYRKV